MSGAVAEALVAEKLAEGRVLLDAILVPDMVGNPPRLPERLVCLRAVRLYQLHVELLAEVARFQEREMDDTKTGRIVSFEPRGEYVVATDDLGQRFITPRGRFDWRPLDEPQPVAVNRGGDGHH